MEIKDYVIFSVVVIISTCIGAFLGNYLAHWSFKRKETKKIKRRLKKLIDDERAQ